LNGLSELLTGALPVGVYQWPVPGSTRRSDVGDAATKAGWRLYWLAGQAVTDQREFLQLCADTFAFPDWFGHNWDALYDCLTDLTWENPSAPHLVIYAGWQALAQEEPESFATALEIFKEAQTLWLDSPTPMAVLLPVTGLEDAPPDLPLLRGNSLDDVTAEPASRRRSGLDEPLPAE
jgi:RNAse (barnase) inhibitor barstar